LDWNALITSCGPAVYTGGISQTTVLGTTERIRQGKAYG
jgi:hypothetical protein